MLRAVFWNIARHSGECGGRGSAVAYPQLAPPLGSISDALSRVAKRLAVLGTPRGGGGEGGEGGGGGRGERECGSSGRVAERFPHCGGAVGHDLPGFYRGYAALGYLGARRRDDGESIDALLRRLNGRLKEAGSVEDILEIVHEYGDDFDYIHVSTAVNVMFKLASPRSRTMLDADERFRKLIDLVRTRCRRFGPQATANVLHGLAVLQADFKVDAVDEELAEALSRAVEREARNMEPRHLAMTFNALGKLRVAAYVMPTAGWQALANRVAMLAPQMNFAHDVSNILNALGKLDAAAAQMPTSGWHGLSRAAEGVAPKMNAQDFSNTLDAFVKLDVAAAAMTTTGWRVLARRVEDLAPKMNAQDVASSLHAYGILHIASEELSWRAGELLEAAAEREARNMNSSKDVQMTRFGCESLGMRTPSALRANPQPPNPKSQTPNPKTRTPSPKPRTPNPKPQTQPRTPAEEPPNPAGRTRSSIRRRSWWVNRCNTRRFRESQILK